MNTEDPLGILPHTSYSTYFVKITEIYEHAKNGKQPGIKSYRDSARPTRNQNTSILSEKYRKDGKKTSKGRQTNNKGASPKTGTPPYFCAKKGHT